MLPLIEYVILVYEGGDISTSGFYILELICEHCTMKLSKISMIASGSYVAMYVSL